MKMKVMGVVLAIAAVAAVAPCMAWAQMDQNSGAGGMQQAQGGTAANAVNPNSQGNSSQPSSMRDSLGAPGQNGQQILDKQFVRSAAQESLADIKLSTLATEKGSQQVKELAQKMVDDHTYLNKDLDSVADSMGVMLPKKLSREQQAEYDKLNGLSGKDFDTEYLTYTLKQHWQALHNFYMESSVAVDPDLQDEVVKALVTMHQHLRLIANTASGEGITLPQRPARPNATSASTAH